MSVTLTDSEGNAIFAIPIILADWEDRLKSMSFLLCLSLEKKQEISPRFGMFADAMFATRETTKNFLPFLLHLTLDKKGRLFFVCHSRHACRLTREQEVCNSIVLFSFFCSFFSVFFKKLILALCWRILQTTYSLYLNLYLNTLVWKDYYFLFFYVLSLFCSLYSSVHYFASHPPLVFFPFFFFFILFWSSNFIPFVPRLGMKLEF